MDDRGCAPDPAARGAVQAPPNLTGDFAPLLDAGIDDFGGVSPVTIDHVNPEAPWPELDLLAPGAASRGLELAPRLTVYPRHIGPARVARPRAAPRVLRASDSLGLAREHDWSPGARSSGEPGRFRRSATVPTAAAPWPSGERELGTSSARTRSPACSGLAATNASACSPRPTPAPGGERRRRHLRRRPGTSSTRTSATSGAASAPSRRGSWPPTCEASPTSCPSTRSCAARSRPGSGRRPRSVSRAGSTRPSTATTTPRSSGRSRTRSRTPRPRLQRPRGAAGRRHAPGSRCTTTWTRLREAASRRCPAPRPRCSTTRCADHLPRQDHDRAVARGARDRARVGAAVEQHDHVRSRRAARSTGRVTCGGPRPPAADRRFHRVRAAPVRAHGDADLPEGARRGPTSASPAHARRGASRAPPRRREHPGVVGQGRPEGLVEPLRAGVNDLGGTLMNESISRAAGAQHGQRMGVEELEAIVAPLGRPLVQRSTLYTSAGA